MKRGKPMKRTGFKRKVRVDRPTVEREPKPWAKPTVMPLHRAEYARIGAAVHPAPKTVERRNPQLLAMAQDMPCLLAIHGVCLGHASRTTVACHSNSAKHGKAGARKADDHYSVWGCMACHRWLDQPIGAHGPTKEEKQAAFDRAHEAQRLAWADIAYDPHGSKLYPPKFRKAARWALDQCIADSKVVA